MSATRWLRIKDHAGRLLLLALVVSVVASVFWYRRVGVNEQQQPAVVLPANNSAAQMVTRDFRHVETRMDRTIWILESSQAEIFESWATLRTVKVTWFGEPGEISVVITSTDGEVDFLGRTAELRGDVRVARADGAVLHTEKLLWSEKTKIMQAPHPVVITTPNFTFRGDGLDANLETQRVILRGRVKGEIRGGSLRSANPS